MYYSSDSGKEKGRRNYSWRESEYGFGKPGYTAKRSN